MATVSVTRLRVRSWRFLPRFFWHALRSAAQIRTANGLQSATILRDDWRTYWTRSVWTDEASMKRYMVTGDHRLAMPSLLDICDEASVGRWDQESSTPPAWSDVHLRMQKEGRPSKVKHPSGAQSAFKIPAPKVRGSAQITLK